MAVTQVRSGQKFHCLSSDTKPTTGVSIGSTLLETDKGAYWEYDGVSWVAVKGRLDSTTLAVTTIDYAHHEAHGSSRFFRHYSVASLGAMEAPDDTITLTWTTPNTTKWEHFTFYVIGTGGWLVEFIEGSTGGGADATGVLPMFNHNRNSLVTATCIDLASGAGNVSYDATKLTGGLSLFSEYIPGGNKSTGSVGADRDEIILAANTKYQLSCLGADTDPCSLHIDWYEHINR